MVSIFRRLSFCVWPGRPAASRATALFAAVQKYYSLDLNDPLGLYSHMHGRAGEATERFDGRVGVSRATSEIRKTTTCRQSM